MLVVSAPWAEVPVKRTCLPRVSLLWVSPVKAFLVGSSLGDCPGIKSWLALKRQMLDRRSLQECVAEKDRIWTLERAWRGYCRTEVRAWWDWRILWLTLWS